MLGNHVAQIVLDPPAAPEPTCTSWDDPRVVHELVNHGDVVAIPIDSVRRIVVCRATMQCAGRRPAEAFAMFGFEGQHYLNVDVTDFARFAAHLSGFIERNKRSSQS